MTMRGIAAAVADGDADDVDSADVAPRHDGSDADGEDG